MTSVETEKLGSRIECTLTPATEAPRRAKTVDLRDVEAVDRRPHLGESFGELARGPARRVRLHRAREVDDLGLREMARHERRGRLEIAAVSEKLPEEITPTAWRRAAASIFA